MHRAAYIDDENAPKEKELLSRLVVENKVKFMNIWMKLVFECIEVEIFNMTHRQGLREMLELSRKYGPGGELLNPAIPTQDKDVQTDAIAGTSTRRKHNPSSSCQL